MNPKELRLGNFVSVLNKGGGQSITEVYSILDEGIQCYNYNIEDNTQLYYCEMFPLDELTPIPITQELLLQFGFEETYKTDIRSKLDHPCNYIGCDINRKTDNKWQLRYYGNYIICDYVHNLQNLFFFLSGNELKYSDI